MHIQMLGSFCQVGIVDQKCVQRIQQITVMVLVIQIDSYNVRVGKIIHVRPVVPSVILGGAQMNDIKGVVLGKEKNTSVF